MVINSRQVFCQFIMPKEMFTVKCHSEGTLKEALNSSCEMEIVFTNARSLSLGSS